MSSAAANSRIANIYACIAISILIATCAISLASHAHLYADGANYMLQLLATRDFVHIAENRIFATYFTQTPIFIALNRYDPALNEAALIYGLSLFATPIFAYGYSLWLTRRDPVAFTLSVAVICIGFMTTAFIIIGEFHVLYSIAWLYAVIITSERRDTLFHQLLLLGAAVLSIKSYEASAVIAPLLGVITLVVMRSSTRATEQAFLVLPALLLLASTAVGVYGYLWPRDPDNAGGFVNSLLKIVENHKLLAVIALVLASAAAAFVRNTIARAALVLAIVAAAFLYLGSGEISGEADRLMLGSPNAQRAQVLPIYLGLIGVLFLNWHFGWGKRIAPESWSFAPLIAPIALLSTIHAIDTLRWRAFLVDVCAELRQPSGPGFFDDPRIKTFGWDWEMPTLSILVRPPGNGTILQYPGYSGWYPFDPATEAPDISAFKRTPGACMVEG